MWGALAAGGIAERDRPAVRCANHSTNVRLWVTRRKGCNVRFWPGAACRWALVRSSGPTIAFDPERPVASPAKRPVGIS